MTLECAISRKGNVIFVQASPLQNTFATTALNCQGGKFDFGCFNVAPVRQLHTYMYLTLDGNIHLSMNNLGVLVIDVCVAECKIPMVFD